MSHQQKIIDDWKAGRISAEELDTSARCHECEAPHQPYHHLCQDCARMSSDPLSKHFELRRIWETFSRGDYLETKELRVLKRSAERGLEYLRARGEHLAAAKTAMDLNRIRDYLDARKKNSVWAA